MDTATVRLDTLAAGASFHMPALNLTGTVLHVSPCQVEVAIWRRPNSAPERTAWACSTEVVEMVADAARLPVSVPQRPRLRAREGVTEPGAGLCQSGSTVTPCPVCGCPVVREGASGQPRRFCSPACRTAAWRGRCTANG